MARIGGDEFAILLAGQQSAAACVEVERKLRRAFEAPFELRKVRHRIGISIGSALILGGRGWNEALTDADDAMYADKRAQKAARSAPPDA